MSNEDLVRTIFEREAHDMVVIAVVEAQGLVVNDMEELVDVMEQFLVVVE